MRGDAVLRPIGPEPAGVYWRRRLVLLAIVAAVVVLLVKVLGGGSSSAPKKLAGGAAHAAAATSAPASAAATGAVAPASACAAGELASTAALSAHAYPAGSPVVVTVQVRNAGTTACVLDTSPTKIVASAASGGIASWSSADCGSPAPALVTLPAGETHPVTVTWDRYRSAAGCPSAVKAQTAGDGTYTLDVAVLGAKVAFAPNAAVFTLS